MPQWIKNLTLLVVLLAWLAVVGATLLQGELPNAAVLGVPAAIVIALAPPIALGRRHNRRGRDDNGDREGPAE